VDGYSVYSVGGHPGDCSAGFIIDLSALGCPNCGGINGTGTHSVEVIGGYGCQGGGGEFNSCVTTTYRVVGADSSANPWAHDFRPLTGVGGIDSAVVTFDPTGSCGVPDCSQIYLIQSVRVLAISGSDSACVPIGDMGYPFGPAGIDSMSATVTPPPECTFIDEVPGDRDPYMNGSDFNDNGSSGRSGSKSNPKHGIR